jgi:hypothetical protein
VLPLVPQLADGERTRLQIIPLSLHFLQSFPTLAVGTFSAALQPERIQNTEYNFTTHYFTGASMAAPDPFRFVLLILL